MHTICRMLVLWVKRSYVPLADDYVWKSMPETWRATLEKLATVGKEPASPAPWWVWWSYDAPPTAQRLATGPVELAS